MNSPSSVPPQFDNPRKRELRERIDATLDEIDSWRKFNAAYHDDDRKFMRFLVPPGKRVLELGCGSGHMLAALEPSYGVGLDFSPKTIASPQTIILVEGTPATVRSGNANGPEMSTGVAGTSKSWQASVRHQFCHPVSNQQMPR